MIGTQELILILIAALFIFGPTKLPEMAQSLGRAVGEFKKAQMETEYELKKTEKQQINDADAKIHNLAIEIGLDVQNKSTQQLVEEIRAKIKLNQGLKLKSEGI